MQNNQNNGNKELISFLTKRFDDIDQKFIVIDKRFDSIEKQLAIFQSQYVADYKDLVDLMVGQFEKVYEKFDEKADKADIDRVLSRITQLNSKVDDNRAEQIGTQKQVAKHEKWHFQVAAKVGLKLLAD